MDNIDTAILYCLKENGRVTASEISKKAKLSSAEKYRKDLGGSLQRKQYCMYNIYSNYLLTICILYDIMHIKTQPKTCTHLRV